MQDQFVLLFDVMDTLVYNPFNYEIPAFFGLTQAELLEQKHPDAWIQFELGRIDEDEYFERYFKDGRAFDFRAFRRVVQDSYRWVGGAKPLLERLNQQGFEIHAISNYPIWYRTIEAQLGLSQFLQWTFVSCLTGVRKPAIPAYEGVARTLNRSPDTLLFIDDCPENCRQTKALGMPTIHFKDTKTLWHELLNRGIVQG